MYVNAFGQELWRAAMATTLAMSAACGGDGDSGTTMPPPAPVYVAGQSYFGQNSYIEYIAGNAPVILTAPHGGTLTPATIADRTAGACGDEVITGSDLNTRELARAMQQQYFARFGKYPHVILANIARRKVDLNRRPPLATCGSAEAEKAYAEWHQFIDAAKQATLTQHAKGFYLDVHGHGHVIPRIEIGYLLSSSELDLSNATLDATRNYEDDSGIQTISRTASVSFATLLRGANSLGTLYANNGIPAIPSTVDPSPKGTDYFNGGDNTRRHTCGTDATAYGGRTGGNICGVQLETHFAGVRDTPANRDNFGRVTAIVLEQYLQLHWNLRLSPP